MVFLYPLSTPPKESMGLSTPSSLPQEVDGVGSATLERHAVLQHLSI